MFPWMFDDDEIKVIDEEEEKYLASLDKEYSDFQEGQKTSAGRYKHRIQSHTSDLSHRVYWVLHNCVAHPLLGLIPDLRTATFHELTSRWLNAPRSSGLHRSVWTHSPDVSKEKRKAWLLHNVVAHIAIGLVPCKTTFDFHDRTAKEMAIKGWV